MGKVVASESVATWLAVGSAALIATPAHVFCLAAHQLQNRNCGNVVECEYGMANNEMLVFAPLLKVLKIWGLCYKQLFLLNYFMFLSGMLLIVLGRYTAFLLYKIS